MLDRLQSVILNFSFTRRKFRKIDLPSVLKSRYGAMLAIYEHNLAFGILKTHIVLHLQFFARHLSIIIGLIDMVSEQ